MTQHPETVRAGLGLALVMLRNRRAMSRTDLAQNAQLSYPYVAELEKGSKFPSSAAFDALAAALEVSPDELAETAIGLANDDPDLLRVLVTAPPAGGLMAGAGNTSGAGVPGDLAARITGEVMRRLEPVIRSAVEAALREEN